MLASKVMTELANDRGFMVNGDFLSCSQFFQSTLVHEEGNSGRGDGGDRGSGAGGVRGILEGELDSAASAGEGAAHLCAPHACSVATAQQAGFKTKHALEAVVNSVRMGMVDNGLVPNACLLSLDFKNAYNTVRRGAVRQFLEKSAPYALSYFDCLYKGDSKVSWLVNNKPEGSLAPGSTQIVSSFNDGIVQGDSMSSFLFCALLQSLMNELIAKHNVKMYAYADDVYILVPAHNLSAFLVDCKSVFGKVGLQMNMQKSFVATSHDENELQLIAEQCEIPFKSMLQRSPEWVSEHGVRGEQTSECAQNGFRVLGVPIGCKEYVQLQLHDFVSELQREMQLLPWQADPQVSAKFLQKCICAKMAFMVKMLPPCVMHPYVQSYVDSIEKSALKIHGVKSSYEGHPSYSLTREEAERIRLLIFLPYSQGGLQYNGYAFERRYAFINEIIRFVRNFKQHPELSDHVQKYACSVAHSVVIERLRLGPKSKRFAPDNSFVDIVSLACKSYVVNSNLMPVEPSTYLMPFAETRVSLAGGRFPHMSGLFKSSDEACEWVEENDVLVRCDTSESVVRILRAAEEIPPPAWRVLSESDSGMRFKKAKNLDTMIMLMSRKSFNKGWFERKAERVRFLERDGNEKARLTATQSPHASRSFSLLPFLRGTTIEPELFFIMSQLRLGIPLDGSELMCEGMSCHFCKKKIEGSVQSHVASCRGISLLRHRLHLSMLNVVCDAVKAAALPVAREVPVYVPDGRSVVDNKRADLVVEGNLLPGFSRSALDVTVVSSLTPTSVNGGGQSSVGHAAKVASDGKIRKYASDAKNNHYNFLPLAFEFNGGFGQGTSEFIRQLSLKGYSKVSSAAFASFWTMLISVALNRSVAQLFVSFISKHSVAAQAQIHASLNPDFVQFVDNGALFPLHSESSVPVSSFSAECGVSGVSDLIRPVSDDDSSICSFTPNAGFTGEDSEDGDDESDDFEE